MATVAIQQITNRKLGIDVTNHAVDFGGNIE